MVISVALGAIDVPFFHFSEPLKIAMWLAATFVAVKIGFKFSTGRTIIVLFTCLAACIPKWFAYHILHCGFNIPIEEYFASLNLRLWFHFFYNIPIAVLAYICYCRQWRMFRESAGVKIPIEMVIGPATQVVLLGIVLNEALYSTIKFGLSRWVAGIVILSILGLPWLLSMFFLWRILRMAEQEAAVSAQEQSAREVARQTDAVRVQRHDFNNHIQIIAGLLKDGRKRELTRYLEALKQDMR